MGAGGPELAAAPSSVYIENKTLLFDSLKSGNFNKIKYTSMIVQIS